jgi:hypothetical protein
MYSGGNYTTITVPGSTQTSAFDIDGNDIVGNYIEGGVTYGFLYDGTSFTTLFVPGSQATSATGISNGEIVGNYTDNDGNINGFLATLAVPEPATWALGIGGVITCLAYWRLRERKGKPV